ncbi:hypothetical protein NSK_006500 [Nannochloropsis salina CCMP1776]|uniref:RecA family profile 1 domain-containing protein n=1 Tax=Nannochloropsis salina CCMP1776 TaxID=1027361 RepID=A0A4D9CSH0_9STRA|nr:hypothetical protein NSK_006500 [Nannochloropsis salina CCMP1776]|eukprot:TFJ82171.1 hypothetical protein NSK_006500 [Nannochloropsis salina CCMP1776]
MTAATLTATTTSSTETRLNNAGGKEIKSAAGFDLFPRPPRTAYDLYQDEKHTRRVSLGCPVLDATFRGGLPGHGVVEVSGMAGAGKTQLMLQLLVQQVRDAEAEWRRAKYATPFVAGRSFYLSTEGPLPAKRLAEMAAATCPEDSGFAQRVLESVIIVEAKNVEDQLYLLTTQLPSLLGDASLGKIRLCVIDSMSALFRGEFSLSKGDTLERAKMIFTMAKQMKRLSDRWGLPFVVTNQVTADFAAATFGVWEGGNADVVGDGVQPALGLSWSNCVHTRFLLSRRDANNLIPSFPTPGSNPPSNPATADARSTGQSSRWIRHMRLLLSPSLPSNLSCRFVLETAGVRGVRRTELNEDGRPRER